MPIPDFQTLMRPLLEVHLDDQDWRRAPLREALADTFQLTEADRAELLPSGTARRFDNRVAWAITHLAHAGLLHRPARGVTRLTERGRRVLDDHQDRVDMRMLDSFAEYREFRGASQTSTASDDEAAEGVAPQAPGAPSATPEEVMQAAYAELNAALAADLLERVLDASSTFFEQLVIDVLLAMGYGGNRVDAGQRLGRSGDGGLDGVIREDLLGLDAIYLQAKRWQVDRAVSRPDVQGFVGALQGARAAKGVFITTSRFTPEAVVYAESVAARVVLVDGRQLSELMLTHGVGVDVRETLHLKRVDEDYFVGEQEFG